jgi:hypothetical protein
MDVYTGKTGSSKHTTFALGCEVLREVLKYASIPRCHVVFMDNFLSAYDLADLRILGFRATGAVREVYLKKYPLEEMKGSDKYDYKCDTKVLTVKWKDNRNECLASNYDLDLNHWSNDLRLVLSKVPN